MNKKRFYGKDPGLTVRFHDSDGNLNDCQLADILYDAAYVINMPIIKRHGDAQWSSLPVQSRTIFGGAGNSLLFGIDPVAMDCVVADLIIAEVLASKAHFYDYLFCAQEAGLGVCGSTRDDPGGDPLRAPYASGYSDIEHIRVDA